MGTKFFVQIGRSIGFIVEDEACAANLNEPFEGRSTDWATKPRQELKKIEPVSDFSSLASGFSAAGGRPRFRPRRGASSPENRIF